MLTRIHKSMAALFGRTAEIFYIFNGIGFQELYLVAEPKASSSQELTSEPYSNPL
jgi:hypothetical protein